MAPKHQLGLAEGSLSYSTVILLLKMAILSHLVGVATINLAK